LFATRDVYLSQVIPNNGESVTQGQVLLELSDDDLTDPVVVPLFLSSKEMAQVFPGMQALATPSGYKRSEVGGIQAEVVSMGKLPSGREDVQARVGVRSLADVIMQKEPAPTLAVLALKRAKSSTGRNTGGYLWSSRGDLPYPPTPGDRLDVEVTTRRVAPIELVLPALRRFFGWSPPETPALCPLRPNHNGSHETLQRHRVKARTDFNTKPLNVVLHRLAPSWPISAEWWSWVSCVWPVV